MSCWVAPAVAAELWGVSLCDVHELMVRGQIPSRQDGGFSFVRLPNYAALGQPLPQAERPPTYSVLTSEQLSAISAPEPKPADHVEDRARVDPEAGSTADEDAQDNRIADWRVGRQNAMRMRRKPAPVS